MMSSSGQTVRISMRDLRVMGRNTQGVKLVNLKEGDKILAVQKVKSESEEVLSEEVASSLPAEGVVSAPPAALASEIPEVENTELDGEELENPERENDES